MSFMSVVKRQIPQAWKQRIKDALTGGGHPELAFVKGVARVQDLYYWVADAEVDTLVPLHNYYSVLFPELDTATRARLQVFGASGEALFEIERDVPAMGSPTLRLSALLRDHGLSAHASGSLLWDLLTPPALRAQLAQLHEPFLLWDRSYIGYVGPAGQATFVHGIDKAKVVDERIGERGWPLPKGAGFVSQPEIPLLVNEARAIDVVVVNRFAAPREFTLSVRDAAGTSRSWSQSLPPRGVHAFRLDEGAVAGLSSDRPLAMTVSGLPSRYGRALVFKRFSGGAISAMHC